MYYKIKNPFAKSHLKRHDIRDAIYEHIVHNILFPETTLQFLGVCEDGREDLYQTDGFAVSGSFSKWETRIKPFANKSKVDHNRLNVVIRLIL